MADRSPSDQTPDFVAQNPQPVVERFNEAFNSHDVDGIMQCMTGDCVFENTRPAPDGTRLVGQAAVRSFWEEFFARSPQARFDAEDLFAAGDRCVVRWTRSEERRVGKECRARW